jgi:hypothetical protein
VAAVELGINPKVVGRWGIEPEPVVTYELSQVLLPACRSMEVRTQGPPEKMPPSDHLAKGERRFVVPWAQPVLAGKRVKFWAGE